MSQTKGRSKTVVNIDGQLLGDYVSAIDDAGRKFLSRLAAQGVRLLASGVYMSHLIKALQR